jgi:hypothetical protein
MHEFNVLEDRGHHSINAWYDREMNFLGAPILWRDRGNKRTRLTATAITMMHLLTAKKRPQPPDI